MHISPHDAEGSPRRKPTRLRGHDYSSSGPYLVTISTYGRQCILSSISGKTVVLTPVGQAARETWLSLPNRFPGLLLDDFVVMPDHFHALLAFATLQTAAARCSIRENLANLRQPERETLMAVGAAPPFSFTPPNSQPISRLGCSLPSVIGAFKSLSTIRVNKLLNTPSKPLWQRTYHDHIIRNADDMKNAQRYILENPLKWSLAKSKTTL